MTTSARDRRRLAAVISAAAGVIHVSASVGHFREYWLFGALFVIVSGLQIAWARLAWHGDSRRLLAAGAILNLGVAVVWVWSRTAGLPFGPDAGAPEQIGAVDAQATADEILTVLLLAGLTTPFLSPRRVWFPRGVEAVALVAVASSFLLAASGLGHS